MTVTTGSAAGPVKSGERIDVLDALRGLALFGMIVVHFHTRVNADATGAESIIPWIIWIGIEAKSWGMFALLFGVGFAVLLRRMEQKGVPFVLFYLRRLAVLAVFGVAAEGLFGFQVLLEYAIWGVPLVFMRRLPTSVLIATAALAAAANPVLTGGAALHWWPPLTSPLVVEQGRGLTAAVKAANETGDFTTLMQARFDLMAFKYVNLRMLVPGATLTLFILGLLAVRHRLIDEPRRHVRTIAAWMAYGFLVWSFYWLVLYRLPRVPIPQLDWQIRSGFGLLNEQWLCLALAGGIVLLWEYRPRWRAVMAWAAPAGRMALTNYLLQAAVIDFISSGYGRPLQLRPMFGVAGAVLLFCLELAISRWWLARYLFGPCEWLWRTLTYGQRQPLRRPIQSADPMTVG